MVFLCSFEYEKFSYDPASQQSIGISIPIIPGGALQKKKSIGKRISLLIMAKTYIGESKG